MHVYPWSWVQVNHTKFGMHCFICTQLSLLCKGAKHRYVLSLRELDINSPPQMQNSYCCCSVSKVGFTTHIQRLQRSRLYAIAADEKQGLRHPRPCIASFINGVFLTLCPTFPLFSFLLTSCLQNSLTPTWQWAESDQHITNTNVVKFLLR